MDSNEIPEPIGWQVDLAPLFDPPLIAPAERAPIFGGGQAVLVQIVLRRAWPLCNFSLVQHDGFVVALVGGAPVAVLPLAEWQRRLHAVVDALPRAADAPERMVTIRAYAVDRGAR